MKRIFILFLILVAATGSYWLYKQTMYSKESVPEQVSIQEVQDASADVLQSDAANGTAVVVYPALPAELNLEAPFYSQAPFSNWDYPWQEACEEASVLLVANVYFEHDWTREEFNEQILALVDWENEVFGSYEHTDVDQTVKILEEYLDLETIVHQDPTFEDVQTILARGHLIVMTFAGKELGNPFFTNGGPIYHAMMIKGYKEGEKVIVHDVGTRRGEDYVYTWEVIENSLHDYAEPIQDGAKRYIEVLPPDSETPSKQSVPDNF